MFHSTTVLRTAILLLSMAATAMASDELILRKNIVESLTGRPIDEKSVREVLANAQPEGTFRGVRYDDANIAGWGAFEHLNQLRVLAVAYVQTGSAFTGDPQMRDVIVRAYNHWVNHEPAYVNSNWWFNEIGVPMALSDSMLLMQEADILPEENFKTALGLIDKALPSQERMTATNRMWLAYATRSGGLLRTLRKNATDDERAAGRAMIERSMERISSTFVITPGDGIQADSSYHAHGPMLYDGGYGLAWISDAGRVAGQTRGTRYGISPAATKIMIDYLLDGGQWMERGDSIDPLTSGREISRQGSNRKALSHRGAAAAGLQLGNGYRAEELKLLQARINQAAETSTFQPSLSLRGNRLYPRSDYLVHQRPEGMFSVKTMSTRTATPEAINGENLKGTHFYSGVNLIHRSGNEYDGLPPVWDWYRLPGTTTPRGGRLLPPTREEGQRGSTPLAGGVSDGMNGLMAYAQDQLGVRARKSWIMIDNVELVMGTGISAAASVSDPVGTSINQCNLVGEVTYSTRAEERKILPGDQQVTPSGVRWVHHDGVGYFFPQPLDKLSISTRRQSGSWRSINNAQPETPIEVPVFSLDLDHGAQPRNAGYTYYMIAGISAQEMEAMWEKAPLKVLEQSQALHAATNASGSLAAATFFAPTVLRGNGWEVALLTADASACVLLDRSGYEMTLSVANPDHREGELQFRTDLHLDGEGASWDQQTQKTTLRIALPQGQKSGTPVTLRYKVGR